MLKDCMIHGQHAVDATFEAGAALTTGMGVVKDFSAKTAKLPTAETSANIFLVQKDRVPTGINASRTQFSDWEAEFNKVDAGDLCLLVTYGPGESFYTDAYASTLDDDDIGAPVAVGTDGKWVAAAAASVYVLTGFYTVNGHTMACIAVGDSTTAVPSAGVGG